MRRLRGIVGRQEVWWAGYLGTVAALLGQVYPSGSVSGDGRMKVSAKWSEGYGKEGFGPGRCVESHL